MKIYIFVFMVLFLLGGESFVLSQVNVDYNYPLKVGNEFSYIKVSHSSFPYSHDSSFVKYRVIKDTLINNKLYFVFDTSLFNRGDKIIRMDTIKGNLLKPHVLNCGNYYGEMLIDSLRAGFNDYVYYCSYFIGKCTDTSRVILFNTLKNGRKFLYDFNSPHSYFSIEKLYAQQFGVYYCYTYSASYYGYSYNRYTMKGCVINDIVYGDTVSYIGVQLISSEIPVSFSLSQNYPNPFNPVTKIKYDIPPLKGVRGMIVRLIIYDILGREIETLVNQTQRPGSYEVTWDGSRYASGVYFYRLITDEYTETKKMVLIK